MRKSRMAMIVATAAVLTTGGVLGGEAGFAAANQAPTGSKDPGALHFSGRQQTLMVKQTEAAVAARYDLVGMDLRFEGRSTAVLNCQWPTGEFLRSAGPNRRTFDESVAFAKDLASRCADQKDLLPHASTSNTARDMDVIRAALGESKLSYLGYSYATYLGALYLQLFPGRADRIVLDSALGPDVWGPGYHRTTSPGTTAMLKDWATWAASRNDRYHLGATTTQVLATVNRINQAAARRPLQIGSYRVDVHLLAVIMLSSSSNEDNTADVQVLRDAARGRKVTPTPSQEQYLALIANPDKDGATSTTAAKVCADGTASPNPEIYYRDIQAHRASEPLFSPMLRNISFCAFWPTTPAEPRTKIHNDVPALIVGASDDPATPLAGQRAMHRAITGSRLITVRGAARHVVYGPLASPRNDCIETAVNHYLLDGTLPTTDTTCTEAGKS